MPYTHVQFIAFENPTLDPFPTGTLNLGQTDFAPINNQQQDAEKRATCLFEAIQWCANNGADANAQTLKVFVAPEFYFRYYEGQNNGNNHYDRKLVRDVINNLIKDCRTYQHWFIVPGTAVVRDTDIRVGLDDPVTFNYMYAFLAGTDINSIILKETYSGIDNMDQAYNAQKSYTNIFAHLQQPTSIVRIPNGRAPGMDLVIGLEICLDHWMHRLKDSATAAGTPIDIHILSACGMNTQSNSIAARTNGYFCRCDGHPSFFGSEMARVTVPVLTPVPGAAPVDAPAAAQVNRGARVLNRVDLRSKIPCRMRIYPSQPL